MTLLTLKDPSLVRNQSFIGGEWQSAGDAKVITVSNPANGTVVATVPRYGMDDYLEIKYMCMGV
ncbi:hypothetical protein [Ensifer canadensis]